MIKRGKFIVIYGANNLGKTTQVKLLVNNLRKQGIKVKRVKYPIYNLKPMGPVINSAMRKNLRITDLDLQKTYAQNRRDYEPELFKILNRGTWVVAEDYKGTGIAWGVVNSISLTKIEKVNDGLYDEDFAILIDGKRFSDGIEGNHRYEVRRDWERARRIHLMLSKRYGWERVNANQTREKVSEDIWGMIQSELI